jgi:hypothetical protein
VCAALAATGALALTGTASAQTTFPEKTGDGVQTGQASIQTYSQRNFISNGSAYFSADLTNGNNTGAQAWNLRTGGTTTTAVPEPLTLSLFGAGLAGAFVARRLRAKA